jgi:hypothetical protein
MALELTGTPESYSRAIALLKTTYSDDNPFFFNLLLAECGFDDSRVLTNLLLLTIERIADLEDSTVDRQLESIRRAVDEVIAEQTEFHTA